MDTLKDMQYNTYDYVSRYTGVPYYYDTLSDREIYGLGSNMNKDVSYVVHKVTERDNLDKLALKYYNNPSYWWVIAYYNDIQDAFSPIFQNFKTLKIPAISQISFRANRD